MKDGLFSSGNGASLRAVAIGLSASGKGAGLGGSASEGSSEDSTRSPMLPFTACEDDLVDFPFPFPALSDCDEDGDGSWLDIGNALAARRFGASFDVFWRGDSPPRSLVTALLLPVVERLVGEDESESKSTTGVLRRGLKWDEEGGVGCLFSTFFSIRFGLGRGLSGLGESS